ncbi:MAG: hypothetical protein ACTSWW_04750 [Promethearchaeota archaeon]
MKIGVFHLNGCTKCRNETLELLDNPELLMRVIEDYEEETSIKLHFCNDPNNLPEAVDLAIFTGYAISDNEHCLKEIRKIAKYVFAFGSCATDGGIFGLACQKGADIFPISKIIPVDEIIPGCLASITELIQLIKEHNRPKPKQLCLSCPRESTCDFLEEVVRQVDLETIDEKQCFNDNGYVCSGYVVEECQERCVDFGTPCRGCKPNISNSGVRMLGMMGTLMGQMEVATEASAKGATDKLADTDDAITAAFPDVVGNFFRFTLANSLVPRGKIPSSGNVLTDIFIGRPIEEIPLITGMMGGKSFISLTLDVLEAYEQGVDLPISDNLKKIRQILRNLETEYQSLCEAEESKKYRKVTQNIRDLAGNMNLSNLFYGGIKTPLSQYPDFEDLRSHPIMIKAGDFSSGNVKFTTNDKGIITKWESDEYEL